MNNFELHNLAQELADTHSSYKLAKILLTACEELVELRNSEPFREYDENLQNLLKVLFND